MPPEKLPRALLSEAFYSIRSERQLMEQKPRRAGRRYAAETGNLLG
jgi:hypothetical protein